MQLVTLCTIGLNDLASDTQDPCAERGQKAVIKSLFICFSYKFPFLTVHQAPRPLRHLRESGGDSSHRQRPSPASLLEQGHPLHRTVSEGGYCLP